MSRWMGRLFRIAVALGAAAARAQQAPPAPEVAFAIVPEQPRYYAGQTVAVNIAVELGEADLAGGIDIDGLPDAGVVQMGRFRQVDAGSPRKLAFTTDAVLLQAGKAVFAPVLSGQLAVRLGGAGFPVRRIFSFHAPARVLELDVLAPPLEGRPPNYSGAVGAFRLSATLSPTTCAVGDLLNLKWSLLGKGAVDDVSGVSYHPGADFRVYPPKATTRDNGVASFAQVIIPTSTNATRAAALEVAVFNPVAGAYETLVAGPFAIRVSERVVEAGATNAPPPFVAPMEVAAANGGEAVRGEPEARGLAWLMGRRRGPVATMEVDSRARLCPDPVSRALFDIPAGAQVELRERHGEWRRVLHGRASGWVPAAVMRSDVPRSGMEPAQ